jgi:hypothetical protein
MSEKIVHTLGSVSLSKAIMGHILTILALVAAMAMWAATVDTRVSTLEQRVDTLEKDMLPLLRDLREDVNDVKVQLAMVSTDVQWLKGAASQEKD